MNPNNDALANSSVLASNEVDGTLSDTPAVGDRAENLPAVSASQLSSRPADGFHVDDSWQKKVSTAAHGHCGEGVYDAGHQGHSDNNDRLLTRATCDAATDSEDAKPTRQLSGDANVDSEHCPQPGYDSDQSPSSLENPLSAPIHIPGSGIPAGATNGSDCVPAQRHLSSIAEDTKPPTTPATSDDVIGGSAIHFPLFYNTKRRSSQMSNPRFTPSGSFIIPADEDIYADLSCGLFSTDPGHIGRVQDVSSLPSPPQRPFVIGDTDQADLVYYSAKDSVAGALTQSAHWPRSRHTSGDHECHSDSEISKHESTLPCDVKVEMIDATSRDVLDEIFKRTSGTFSSVVLLCNV